ncbi:unconventional myosin-Ic isoform X2 [Patella vulgata]|uniref:unconventional myosin-Ic isoform X2 n=1 Tax=Patella vulgata TaxID=6465 RepID=UPI00217F3B20|nr:unconventional myosin-Ic isoform X2 [Patella vulgata]
MENELHKRDHLGVQDFVLLEDYHNQDAFLDNLRKRFEGNLIYTYIGPVLVSINPYHELDIYNTEFIQTYRNVNFYELPPHIFAIADASYTSMRGENKDQCILISGESGAGKTEASKKILQYIAANSTHSVDVERVKDRLLQSNPILESFGNAKTNRNDNSSRFGKYMDIQFDYKGAPVGGHILNYLLEKSRVVHQGQGERNFHIFYQLIQGGSPALLEKLKLDRNPDKYFYLNQGNCSNDVTHDDQNLRVIQEAMETCDFSEKEQEALYCIVASVLHLGDLTYEVNESGMAKLTDDKQGLVIAQLLGCEGDTLESALHNRTIDARGEKLKTPLNVDQAMYARDALAKGIYDRLFTWMVQKINKALAKKDKLKCSLMGLLDIYGFEIFVMNSFEQFCINYCNEKLQQLFIQLTLKSEQEEYQREGIEWVPVQYFNNKIICDVVEGKPMGIIAILDEECLRPGEPSDETFLEKLSETIGQHPHFVSHKIASSSTRKTIQRDEFRLIHYAGDVTYNVKGFLDKNNDLLFRDLKEAMSQTTNLITSECFPSEELQSKKRPETAATQFKTSLSMLMDILMSKEPSYVRCIKPNEYKRAGVFDERIVTHQVKYLGLMENLRVRRAGFAYRRPYEVFLRRYKCLCPSTWPHYHGLPKEGTAELVNYLNYQQDDFRMGKTKLFIRFPRVLFATEDAFQLKKHDLATQIQSQYRGFTQRKKFLHMRLSAIIVQCHWRRYAAKKLLEKRKKAAQDVRKFIIGFMNRKKPACDENQHFIKYTKWNFLEKLKNELPKNVLNKKWPKAPELLEETSNDLHKLCMKNLVLKYIKNLKPAKKIQLEQKVIAERLFKGKKESYKFSIKEPFIDSRLAAHHEALKNSVFDATVKQLDEKVIYCSAVTKYDRHGYKSRNRVMIVTEKNIYVLNEKDFKVKDKLPFQHLSGIIVSPYTDGLFVLTVNITDNGSKGDLILQSDYVIEAVTKIAIAGHKQDVVQVATDGNINHDMLSGKQGLIEFSKGSTYNIKKGKNGQLCVVAPPLS